MKSLLISVLGLGVAGGSVFVANQYVTDQAATQARAVTASSNEVEMVQVIVAAEDIPFGGKIERLKLTSQRWPAEAVPPGAFTSLDVLLGDAGQYRHARRPIGRGDPLTPARVSDFGERVTITQSLAPDRRAVAIQVDAVTSVGGFVAPGDRVDIILTQMRGEGFRSGTILQNVRVIGTDQSADEMRDTARVARTVTVDVSPEDGQVLALAQQAGRLSLTLRTVGDDNQTALGIVHLDDLLWIEPPLPPEPEPVAEPAPAPAVEAPAPQRRITINRGLTDTRVITLD